MSDNPEVVTQKTATEWVKTIGSNIKYLRKACGLSQYDIADVLDVSYQQIQKYEHGTNRLPLEKLCELKRFYNVPYDVFFRDISEETLMNQKKLLQNKAFQIHLKLRKVKDITLKRKIERIILILLEDQKF